MREQIKRFYVAALDPKDAMIAKGLEVLVNDPKAEDHLLKTAKLIGQVQEALEEATDESRPC